MQIQRAPRTLSATSLIGDRVVNHDGIDLGEIRDLMLDLPSGRIAYAVLESGGVLGFRAHFHAVPWEAFDVDPVRRCLVLDVAADALEARAGFDRLAWPEEGDPWFLDDHEVEMEVVDIAAFTDRHRTREEVL